MKTIKIILSIIFAGVFIFSGYKIFSYLIEQKKANDLYDNFKDIAITSEPNESSNNDSESKIDFSIDFESLKNECKDVVGWIYSPDTPINYPVVRGKDNKQYLRHLPNGKYNYAGSIFADYRNLYINNDSNVIIYGHNMKNDSMFGTLTEYYKQKYYDAHPVLYFLTPEKNYEVQLISGYITSSDSTAYMIERDEELNEKYIDRIMRSSTFDGSVEYKKGDRTLTLSTCTNASNSQKYVMVGILKEIEQ